MSRTHWPSQASNIKAVAWERRGMPSHLRLLFFVSRAEVPLCPEIKLPCLQRPANLLGFAVRQWPGTSQSPMRIMQDLVQYARPWTNNLPKGSL